MKRKIIEPLVPFTTGSGANYLVGEIYSIPEELADDLVKRGAARYVKVDREKKQKAPPPPGVDAPWQETVRPGDSFEWQITLALPKLAKPSILRKFDDPEDESSDKRTGPYLREVGGFGDKPTPTQVKVVEYLRANEAALLKIGLTALAKYSATFRNDWLRQGVKLANRIVPAKMTAAQSAERICFTDVCIPKRARDGIAYLELHGECAWDREHGFYLVLHRKRVVTVLQQGSGWSDRGAGK
jgi:hypothetical protein